MPSKKKKKNLKIEQLTWSRGLRIPIQRTTTELILPPKIILVIDVDYKINFPATLIKHLLKNKKVGDLQIKPINS